MADILVVDDSPVVRRMLGFMLERDGHRVSFASNGSEGLAAVEARNPNLIIADLAMPVMDGMAFVRRLKADPAWNQLPIVMLTASAEAKDHSAALALGVDGFVTKPLRSIQMIELVDGLLKKPNP
ncbi:MAG TPA: response regulator [Candidatus Dormibacteraeota bacterium]